MILTELPRRTPAIVASVEDHGANDNIARRLRELGFVAGEEVEIVAQGPRFFSGGIFSDYVFTLVAAGAPLLQKTSV